MKAFSIQQPWGTLICSGLKDVENRKWALKTVPVTVLIHTGAKRHDIDEETMPLVWFNPIDNMQTMGGIGLLKEMPTSAVVGIATIDRCEEGNMSKWAQRGHGAEYQWVMRDVKLFKEPIKGIKGKLGIFDIPEITPDNLPECMVMPKIERNGSHMRIPLNRELYKALVDGNNDTVTFNVTDENLPLFGDEELQPHLTETVTFVCGDESFDATVSDYYLSEVTNEDTNEVFTFEDALGREYEWWKAVIVVE